MRTESQKRANEKYRQKCNIDNFPDYISPNEDEKDED
nr:MAG TPA: hypothetical protein [Caudoviricetes sp.]